MKAIVGFVVSLAVNGTALAVLQMDLQHLQAPPGGEVSIVQLPQHADAPLYAQAAQSRSRAHNAW
jgi:hypothetical protein